MRLIAVLLAWGFLATAGARAEIAESSAGGFAIRAEASVSASPEAAWRALTDIAGWWNPEHTYSGDARRLRLDVNAGGCWCERWGDGQSVEHARVVLVMEHEGVRTLRLVGGLGPLQEMGAAGVLTFTIAPDPKGAKIAMIYRVSGDPNVNFNQLASAVDGVLMEQFGRLTQFAEAGGSR